MHLNLSFRISVSITFSMAGGMYSTYLECGPVVFPLDCGTSVAEAPTAIVDRGVVWLNVSTIWKKVIDTSSLTSCDYSNITHRLHSLRRMQRVLL